MTPDWAFQLLWFGAGIGGTGAVWYFLSQRDFHTALWTGFVTVVAVALTITLHIRNDLIKREQLRSTVRRVLTSPDAVPDSAAARSMIERLLRDQTPRKLFNTLMNRDDSDIARIPNTGPSLQEFMRSYYRFSTDATTLETELMNRIGGTVRVRFREGWAIYLRYAIHRFAGAPKEEIIAGGNFLNYDITWDDAERVYTELSNDQGIARTFRDLLTRYESLIATVNTLKTSI